LSVRREEGDVGKSKLEAALSRVSLYIAGDKRQEFYEFYDRIMEAADRRVRIDLADLVATLMYCFSVPEERAADFLESLVSDKVNYYTIVAGTLRVAKEKRRKMTPEDCRFAQAE